MDFATGLLKAYKTRWSYINTFRVQFHFGVHKSKAEKIMEWTREDDESINLNIVNISTPQFQNQPIEIFSANTWRIHNGRDELTKFSITFRDQDQMKYYRKFATLYKKTKEDYFDHVSFDIQIYKDADYLGENEKTLMYLDECIIESVSQLQFSNTTENQIAEFTVNFKCLRTIIY